MAGTYQKTRLSIGSGRRCFPLVAMSYSEQSEASLATDESSQPALATLKSFRLKLPQVVPRGLDINSVCSLRGGGLSSILAAHICRRVRLIIY